MDMVLDRTDLRVGQLVDEVELEHPLRKRSIKCLENVCSTIRAICPVLQLLLPPLALQLNLTMVAVPLLVADPSIRIHQHRWMALAWIRWKWNTAVAWNTLRIHTVIITTLFINWPLDGAQGAVADRNSSLRLCRPHQSCHLDYVFYCNVIYTATHLFFRFCFCFLSRRCARNGPRPS